MKRDNVLSDKHSLEGAHIKEGLYKTHFLTQYLFTSIGYVGLQWAVEFL
jgi:hypothetical protein